MTVLNFSVKVSGWNNTTSLGDYQKGERNNEENNSKEAFPGGTLYLKEQQCKIIEK